MRTRGARAHSAIALLLGGCLTAGCGSAPSAGVSGSNWLSRDQDEQRLQLERHLRGFDVAMMEVGHRYRELYWAGEDANWDAAAYQLQKLRLAIENGLERRPKRASSARPFLEGPLTAMDAAVAARDPQHFAARFQDLTAGCNACHAKEQVPFFEILPPEVRVSPMRRGRGIGAE
jgi:hypothetical protein